MEFYWLHSVFFIKTLLVSWIRASMVTKIPAKLWDQLLNVLSSLTTWKEVIIEWKVCYIVCECLSVCACVCVRACVC